MKEIIRMIITKVCVCVSRWQPSPLVQRAVNNTSATAVGCPDCSTLQVRDVSLIPADSSKVLGSTPQGAQALSRDTPASSQNQKTLYIGGIDKYSNPEKNE